MDKALESVIGFISVLPGAFSAYRWDAIKNNERGEGALKIYFKPLLPGPEMSVFGKCIHSCISYSSVYACLVHTKREEHVPC